MKCPSCGKESYKKLTDETNEECGKLCQECGFQSLRPSTITAQEIDYNLDHITYMEKNKGLESPLDRTDEEILEYINAGNENCKFDNALDNKMHLYELNNLWKEGPYLLILQTPEYKHVSSAILTTKTPLIPSSKTVVAMFRMGYSRFMSHNYVVLSQAMGGWPIARGELDFLEKLQVRYDEFGLKTEIIFGKLKL